MSECKLVCRHCGGDHLPSSPCALRIVPDHDTSFDVVGPQPVPVVLTPTWEKTKVDGGGLRFDQGKARFDLVAPEALYALAEHYLKGTQILKEDGTPKYAERNWERGMAWCKCFACIMRHSWKWMMGEDYDAETGSHHMIAAAWNCFAIFTYQTRGIGTDDRPAVLRSGGR